MTSVEFVIWMRGFLAGARNDEGIGIQRVVVLREQMAKVDGIPLPRDKRTNLRTPPILLPENCESVEKLDEPLPQREDPMAARKAGGK
jgi:hypothetical protein